MESKLYSYTLKEFFDLKPAAVQLGDVEIREGEIVELNYSYVHSKSILIMQIIKQAVNLIDLVVFFDMSFSFDFCELSQTVSLDKILVYKIYSASEFFLYMISLFSFIKDCKLRVFVIIDSWNTYFWNEKPREGLLEDLLNKKIWESVESLKNRFGVTFFICKKASISQDKKILTSFGTFWMNNYEKFEKVSKILLILEPIISETSLLHALYNENTKKINIFSYPFEWKACELEQ